MHGPEEVEFANETFNKVEKILNLPQYTVKLGIMDEERRTSVNLFECIRAAKKIELLLLILDFWIEQVMRYIPLWKLVHFLKRRHENYKMDKFI